MIATNCAVLRSRPWRWLGFIALSACSTACSTACSIACSTACSTVGSTAGGAEPTDGSGVEEPGSEAPGTQTHGSETNASGGPSGNPTPGDSRDGETLSRAGASGGDPASTAPSVTSGELSHSGPAGADSSGVGETIASSNSVTVSADDGSDAESTAPPSTDAACARAAACGSHKWACWPMPTPASEGAPHPQSYRDNGDGTVTDNVTCLTWEQANPSSSGTFQDAADRCAVLAASGFGGHDDWRLPTRIEMASITDVTRGSNGFPAVFTVTSGYYVTASLWYKTILTANDANPDNDEDRVWGYGSNGFTSNAIVRENTDNVARCVRGNGDGEAPDAYAVEPPNHYTIDGDLVTDNYTGLVWQRARSPMLVPFAEAAAYCEQLSLGGHSDFRVPTLNELATTVNEAKVGGAVVDEAFPDNPVGCKEPQYWFWAAEASQVGGDGWGLSYCDGFTGWNAGASGDWNYFPTANVRCVR